MKHSDERLFIIYKLLSVTVFLLVLIPLNLNAESCDSQCTDRGFNSHSSQGTAPFCSGSCDDWKNGTYANFKGSDVANPITDVGSSSDGKSCTTGHKRCCCRKVLDDCKSTCHNAGYGGFKCSGYYPDGKGWDEMIPGWCDDLNICYCGPDPYWGHNQNCGPEPAYLVRSCPGCCGSDSECPEGKKCTIHTGKCE